MTEDEKKKIEADQTDLSNALQGSDLQDIKDKKEKLEKSIQEATVRLYQQQAEAEQQTEAAEAKEGTAEGKKVVDADYEEIKEEEKEAK